MVSDIIAMRVIATSKKYLKVHETTPQQDWRMLCNTFRQLKQGTIVLTAHA
jgi:hypothetical protein